MKLFTPHKEYYQYISSLNPLMIKREHLLGFIIRLEGFIYFIPVLKLDDSDYNIDKTIKKSTPAISRIIDNETNLNFKIMYSNMFPIPYKEVINIKDNQALIIKINKYILDNQKRLNIAAKRIYKQKIKNYDQQYLKSTLDFKKIENECLNWELNKYGKHHNRFPDNDYFIENPFKHGDTEYFLMNKNIKVAKLLINNESQKIISIIEIYNIDYAPLECFEKHYLNANSITNWFKGRGIPSWREGLDDFLNNSGIKTEILLLNKAFGLSLSDQYWMNPCDLNMNWQDINFFNHDFNSSDFIEATFENKIINKEHVCFYTPNNTTDGMLKKTWIVENNKRYLLKGSYNNKNFEPFAEVLASKLFHILNLDAVKYDIDYLNNIVISKCECFINEDTELISAYAILKYYEIDLINSKPEDIYNNYAQILEKNGLMNVKEELAKMYIVDYLICNSDRHLGNFGIIRNVNNLKWVKIAPIYDSGQSMFSQSEVYKMNFINVYGSFFNNKEYDYELILDIVLKDTDIKINFNELIETVKIWKNILLSNQDKSSLTSDKIEACYLGLLYRIDKLSKRFS